MQSYNEEKLMKRTLLIFTFLLSLIAGTVFAVALPKAESNLENYLQTLGFEKVTIGRTSLTLTGLRAKNITLDQDGLNTIDQLQAELFWPAYLINNKIDSMIIEKLSIMSVIDDIQSLFSHKQKLKIFNIPNIPINKLNIKKIIWDIASPQGAIRLESAVLIATKNSQKQLLAFITANQHQLSFTSQWQGHFDDKNGVQLDGTFDDVRINYEPVRMSRGTGWLSYNINDEINNFSAQLDAGNGTVFGIPSKNISVLIGQEKTHRPILFRAQASGIKGVDLTADLHLSSDPEHTSFSGSLQIKNMFDFVKHFKTLNPQKNINANAFKDIKQLDILVNYLNERRFSGGPLPFDIKVKRDLKPDSSGTFLIYPDSLDIRGTIESNKKLINAFQPLLGISKKHISDNTIRLEGNIKSGLTNAKTTQ